MSVITTSAPVGTSFEVTTNDRGTMTMSVASGGTGGGVEPFPNVFWVNPATTADTRDGSISAPYRSITEAVSAHLTGATLYLVPNDYTAEGAIVLPSGARWTLVGLDPSTAAAPYEGADDGLARIQGISVPANESELAIVTLVNVRVVADIIVAEGLIGLVQADACSLQNVTGNTSELIATNARFALNSALHLRYLTLTRCQSQAMVCNITLTKQVYMAQCSGQIDVLFDSEGCYVFCDPWTVNALNTLGNCVPVLVGMQRQFITGATTQEQVDSIVQAGVRLNIFVDGRTTV